ncbi:MAG: hypothetical protein ACR2OW_01790 [Methyloligellaceae bacterium]
MAEIGDIYEIDLTRGFGYAKVTHYHQTYPDVLRIDPRNYDHPLEDPGDANFENIVLYPLAQSIEGGRIKARKCLNDPHFPRVLPFPNFRFAIRDRQGHSIYWWIWNGDSIVPADPDQDISNLPIRRILSRDEFIEIWRTLP